MSELDKRRDELLRIKNELDSSTDALSLEYRELGLKAQIIDNQVADIEQRVADLDEEITEINTNSEEYQKFVKLKNEEQILYKKCAVLDEQREELPGSS